MCLYARKHYTRKQYIILRQNVEIHNIKPIMYRIIPLLNISLIYWSKHINNANMPQFMADHIIETTI